MRYPSGAPVTVKTEARKPYILEFQYYAHVTRTDAAGYFITLGPTSKRREFGPFAEQDLLPGWKDDGGRWRL